jgi:hypothetical protein
MLETQPYATPSWFQSLDGRNQDGVSFSPQRAPIELAIALITIQEIKLNISKNTLWGHWQGT